MSEYNSLCTLWSSMYSLYGVKQTTGLCALSCAVPTGIHQPQSEVRCIPGAYTSKGQVPRGHKVGTDEWMEF